MAATSRQLMFSSMGPTTASPVLKFGLQLSKGDIFNNISECSDGRHPQAAVCAPVSKLYLMLSSFPILAVPGPGLWTGASRLDNPHRQLLRTADCISCCGLRTADCISCCGLRYVGTADRSSGGCPAPTGRYLLPDRTAPRPDSSPRAHPDPAGPVPTAGPETGPELHNSVRAGGPTP